MIAAVVNAIKGMNETEVDVAAVTALGRLASIEAAVDFWGSLALWGVDIYSILMKSPDEEVRRRYFNVYAQAKRSFFLSFSS